jgi:hypothetical protein
VEYTTLGDTGTTVSRICHRDAQVVATEYASPRGATTPTPPD